MRRHFNSQKRPEQLDAEFQRGVESGKAQATPYDLKCEIEKAEKLRKRVEEFEVASGVKIDHWIDPKDIGAAVKAVLECGEERIAEKLQYARREVGDLLKEIDATISNIAVASVPDNKS